MKKKPTDSRRDSDERKDASEDWKQPSENMRRLGELLDEPWDDDEPSDVHIQEAHFYGNEIPTLNLKKQQSEEVTRPDNEKPTKPPSAPPPRSQPTLSPRAKKLSLLITIILTALAGAVKMLIDKWSP